MQFPIVLTVKLKRSMQCHGTASQVSSETNAKLDRVAQHLADLEARIDGRHPQAPPVLTGPQSAPLGQNSREQDIERYLQQSPTIMGLQHGMNTLSTRVASTESSMERIAGQNDQILRLLQDRQPGGVGGGAAQDQAAGANGNGNNVNNIIVQALRNYQDQGAVLVDDGRHNNFQALVGTQKEAPENMPCPMPAYLAHMYSAKSLAQWKLKLGQLNVPQNALGGVQSKPDVIYILTHVLTNGLDGLQPQA